MIQKSNLKGKLLMLFHKFSRFTKQQKVFVLYLCGLVFFLIFFPLIKVAPVDGDTYRVRLLSGALFKVMLIVIVALAVLVGRNMSFRFKNIVINYFGFKENDALINFALLFIISTALLGIGDTINVVQNTTSTIRVTGSYYFIELLLLAGLVLTLMSVVKTAKLQGGKTKIINVIDEDALKEVSHKKSLKGLFDEEEEDEELANMHHAHHTEHEHHEHEHLHHVHHEEE
ncbi:MAG: hypothetical protein CO170_02120 [candidate division SR1 bacterium CG_4_9_14_3_um_filter_40_9]|nr:MAG: hypothetical protein CO170_02120 [candidate division SR1 bacterium CG_4_9_14_3_um_filter_40_9]